jgi:hypothetical protein
MRKPPLKLLYRPRRVECPRCEVRMEVRRKLGPRGGVQAPDVRLTAISGHGVTDTPV